MKIIRLLVRKLIIPVKLGGKRLAEEDGQQTALSLSNFVVLTRSLRHLQLARVPSLIDTRSRNSIYVQCGPKLDVSDQFLELHPEIPNKGGFTVKCE